MERNLLPPHPEPALIVVGVYFGDAETGVRRHLALDPARLDTVADRLRSHRPDWEAVLISTCNRTELVLADERGITPAAAIGAFHLALGIPVAGADAPCLDDRSRPAVWTDRDAVEHLFRVACGLDSALLGDNEIVGQLRAAWRTADESGRSGPTLRRVFRDAFAVAKRARNTTSIGAGGAGIGSAVAAAVADRDGPALVVGAGEAARTVVRRLAKQVPAITIANRSVERAAALAAEVGGDAVGLDGLDAALAAADTVVTAVAAPIIDADRLGAIRTARPDWRPLIVDAGSPPNVEPVDGFDIVGLDTLAHRRDARDRERAAAVPGVETLIAGALARRAHPTPEHT